MDTLCAFGKLPVLAPGSTTQPLSPFLGVGALPFNELDGDVPFGVGVDLLAGRVINALHLVRFLTVCQRAFESADNMLSLILQKSKTVTIADSSLFENLCPAFRDFLIRWSLCYEYSGGKKHDTRSER